MCKFQHTLQTKASKKAIWNLWTHVNTWPLWDFHIREATLEKPFAPGVKGCMHLKDNSQIPFIITSYNTYKNLTIKTKRFLCTILFHHELHEQTGYQQVTHRIQFFGPLKYIYWLFLGNNMKKTMQLALEKLIVHAEQKKAH